MSSQDNNLSINTIIKAFSFVSNSYMSGCLKLFSQMEKMECSDIIKNELFLPAMFCFRHYIELRLKFIYARTKKTTTDEVKQLAGKNGHKLQSLLQAIKGKGVNTTVFDEPIKFINTYENNEVEYFRYMIDKNFQSYNELKEILNYYKKIREYILSIERFIENYYTNEFLMDLYNYEVTNNGKIENE